MRSSPGRPPAIRIYEDDDYLAILDSRPFTRGHTLVFPKRHTLDLTDTPPQTLADMVTIGQLIARAACGLPAWGRVVPVFRTARFRGTWTVANLLRSLVRWLNLTNLPMNAYRFTVRLSEATH